MISGGRFFAHQCAELKSYYAPRSVRGLPLMLEEADI